MKFKEEDNWIIIKNSHKNTKMPSEIRIDKAGRVFLDGELYDDNKAKYKNYSINVEQYNKVNTGEETRKLIESQKNARSGETKIIKDIKDKDRIEKTTVKF